MRGSTLVATSAAVFESVVARAEARYHRAVPHRDDREAERARIESLEAQLEQAEARAARAEKEARAAEEHARAAEKKAAKAAKSAKAREQEEEARRRKERRARKAEAAEQAPEPVPAGWSAEGKRRYFRSSLALSVCAYGALLPYYASLSERDVERSLALGMLASLAVLMTGQFVIGLVTRAPSAFSGAMNTMISCALAYGGLVVLAADALFDGAVPDVIDKPLRAVLALVVVGVGAAVTASWSADAASSPISAD